MVIELKSIIEEVSKFIDENVNEFEFIVDINNLELLSFDINDLSFNISECCNVFVRKLGDNSIEEEYIDYIVKKVYKGDLILYLVI